MFDLKNVDVKLLREQRNALLGSVEEASGFALHGPADQREEREKQVDMLDGIVVMIDDMLDAIEVQNFSRPIEMAQHPLWEDTEI